MENELKDERGWYLPEVKAAVIAEIRRGGVWAAVERYGIPHATVAMWAGQERKRAREAERHYGSPETTRKQTESTIQVHRNREEGIKKTWRVHSNDERETAVNEVLQLGVAEVARKYKVSEQTIRNWRAEMFSAGDHGNDRSLENPGSRIVAAGTNVEVESISSETWERVGTPEKAGNGRRYSPSEKANAIGEAMEHGVAKAARRYGATRHTLYRWIRKAKVEAGDPVIRRWERSEAEEQRDLEILHEWHKQPGLGPMQIRNQLRRRGVRTSVHTVRRVMEDNGYRPPKVESQSHHERYEAVRPNQLWHLDFVHRHINLAGTFTLILLDDRSRFVVGHEVSDAERAEVVIQTFEAAVERYGCPEAVMTDRGAAFWAWRGISRFTKLLEEMGIDQYVAEDKELNGKVEVFNANLAKELFNKQRFEDVGAMRAGLKQHVHWYNHQRTHQALGGILVPADRYYGRVEEVMQQLENGADQASDPHDPQVGARLLCLFQVISRQGRPEVWLLGQRIL